MYMCFIFSVGLTIIDGGTKFIRKGQPITFECPLARQTFKHWQIDGEEIDGITKSVFKSDSIEANVLPGNASILNITILSNSDVAFLCVKTDSRIKFKAIPIFSKYQI